MTGSLPSASVLDAFVNMGRPASRDAVKLAHRSDSTP